MTGIKFIDRERIKGKVVLGGIRSQNIKTDEILLSINEVPTEYLGKFNRLVVSLLSVLFCHLYVDPMTKYKEVAFMSFWRIKQNAKMSRNQDVELAV